MVAGDHAHLDPGLLAERDRVPRLLARRVDDADQGEQRQVLHLREQVAAGVEARRVDVARGRRRARAGPRRRGGRSRPGRGRGRPPRARSRRRRPGSCDERASSTSGAPLTKQRTTLRPSSSISWNVAMNLYSESNGTSPTRGKRRRVSSTSSPPFAARTTSAASVGSPTISPSRTAASFASAIGRRNGSSERLRLARDAEDLALGRVALALDRVAAPDDDELARGHLVERQRAGLVGADRRGRAERLHRPEPLHDRALRRERLRPEREHRRDDRGQAGRDRRDRERDADHEQLVEVVAADAARRRSRAPARPRP